MDLKNLDLNKLIDSFEQNLRKDYDILFSALKGNNTTGDKLDEAALLVIIKQFHISVVRLGYSHVNLVNEILKIDWTKGSEDLSQEFQFFILDLLAAQTALYLHECLKIIINQFAPKGPLAMMKSIDEMTPEEVESVKFRDQRRHDLLQKIIKIVPSSVMLLESLISQCYPPPGILKAQEIYAMNLLSMAKYLPKMRGYILKLILTVMIVYDSEALREDIQRMEMENILTDGDPEPMESKKAMKHPSANLLDRLMNLVFTYIKEQCFKENELMWEDTKKLYIDMKKAFGLLLLRTFKACHVQFLMFYLCSFKLDLTLDFLEFLWNEVASLNKDFIQRQLAVAYLGSYLARAKYIPVWLVKRQLIRMKTWIHNYIDNSSNQFRPIFEVHGVFYMVCQAFFYMIVFRHKDIIDTKHENSAGHKFCMDLHLQKITSSLLNPLRFCYLPITEMFCSVVRSNQIAFCDNILERNRRQMIADSSLDSIRNFIISYFPYDPYVLNRSLHFIEPIYLDYDDETLNMNIKKGKLDEEMDYEEFEEKDPIVLNMSQAIDIQISPKMKSFFLYGSSPGFKH